MKIKIPQHGIQEVEHLSLKDIPLSYINIDDVDREPQILINDSFIESSRQYVRPFDSFSDDNIYMFDKDNNLVEKQKFKRIEDTYYYEPNNTTEFVPLQFSVALEIKRNMTYTNSKIYNITAAVLESDDQASLSNKLIAIFGDAYKTSVCPSNIIFNNGDMLPQQLTATEISKADFVFMKSYDGRHFGYNDDAEHLINFDDYLDDHHNIWLSVSTFGEMITTLEKPDIFDATLDIPIYSNILYSAEFLNLDREMVAGFNFSRTNPYFPEGEYEYSAISDCILVLHKPGRGYIIVSPNWILENLAETSSMVYEALMYVYLNSYYRSKEIALWCTDSPVDYYAYHLKQYNKAYSKVNIRQFLSSITDEVGDEFDILSVSVSTDAVVYTGLDSNDDLTFFKIGGEADPVKKPYELSCFTTKGSVIYYTQEDVSLVEQPIDIDATVVNSGTYLIVHPFVSSSKKICTTVDQTFQITDYIMDYELFALPSTRGVDNLFVLLARTEKPTDDMISVARIKFNVGTKVQACDARIGGGGLPPDQVKDYDLLDIGYIQGRPYRLGGTLIFRLPKTLEQFRTRIRTEIYKHIASGVYAVLVFDQ